MIFIVRMGIKIPNKIRIEIVEIVHVRSDTSGSYSKEW